jgi:hypothetical protein
LNLQKEVYKNTIRHRPGRVGRSSHRANYCGT